MSRRADRINGLLRQEISVLLSREIKDPRLSGVISITQVETTSDLRNAHVYVSVMGRRGHQERCSGWNKVSGHISPAVPARPSQAAVCAFPQVLFR